MNNVKCTTCGMERGEHDRACVQEQLHQQKLRIMQRLAGLKAMHQGDDFVARLGKSTVEAAMEIVREA